MARSSELVGDTALQGHVQTPPERRSEGRGRKCVGVGKDKQRGGKQKEKSTAIHPGHQRPPRPRFAARIGYIPCQKSAKSHAQQGRGFNAHRVPPCRELARGRYCATPLAGGVHNFPVRIPTSVHGCYVGFKVKPLSQITNK